MKKQVITVSDIFDCCQERPVIFNGQLENLEQYCEQLEVVLRAVLGVMPKKKLLAVYEYMNDSTEHWKNVREYWGENMVEFVAENGDE